jgi:hypothetical protein
MSRVLRWLLIATSTLGLFVACSNNSDIAGGGTRGGNPVVVGTAVGSDSIPVVGALVTVAASRYDPLDTSMAELLATDTTDADGAFAVQLPRAEYFTVLITDREGGTGAFLGGVAVSEGDTTVVPSAMLDSLGTLTIAFAYEVSQGEAGIAGTALRTSVPAGARTVSFTAVPSLMRSDVLYRASAGQRTLTLLSNGLLQDTVHVDTAGVSAGKLRVLLVTTASGAGVPDDVVNFPMCIRFTDAQSQVFDGSGEGGDSLFFVDSEGQTLPSEIEQWDAAAGTGVVWVAIDTVKGDDTTVVTVYWGGDLPPPRWSGRPVFDTAHGFGAVYHMNDLHAASAVRDATPAGRHGRAQASATPPHLVAGVVGGAQRFTDTTARITAQTASYPNGTWTLSAWFSPKRPMNQGRVVSDGSSSVRLSWGASGEANMLSNVKVHLSCEAPDSFMNTGIGPLALVWHHVAATCDTSAHRCVFYVDGEPVDTISWVDRAPATFESPIQMGGPYVEPFEGMIDEVRLSGVMRSDAWFRLVYANQRVEQSLVWFE